MGEPEEYYQKFIDYIENTGGEPKVEWFDEDWEPIGPTVRKDLIRQGRVIEVNGTLKLA